MQLVDLQDFRQWAQESGFAWSESYPQCPVLGPNALKFAWPWPRPDGYSRSWQVADFFYDVVNCSSLGKQDGWFLWPHNGQWKEGPKDHYYRVRDTILRSLGVFMDEKGAAHFCNEELAEVVTVVFANCFMMDDCEGTVADHILIFPHHGQLCLNVVDEQLIWISTSSNDCLETFNRNLARLGWGWLRDESQNDLLSPLALDIRND